MCFSFFLLFIKTNVPLFFLYWLKHDTKCPVFFPPLSIKLPLKVNKLKEQNRGVQRFRKIC